MNKMIKTLLLFILIAGVGVGGYFFGTKQAGMKGTMNGPNNGMTHDDAVAPTPGNKGKKIKHWVAPMTPGYVSDKPGKSPMGMDLVPVYEDDDQNGGIAAVPGSVKIDPVTIQNIGVRTALIEERRISKRIRTIGIVAYDEKSVAQIQTKVDGWIEKLYVDFTGQAVDDDQMLAELYSPELVAAQEEYLVALDSVRQERSMKRRGRGKSMLSAARAKLDYLDIPIHQIEALERDREIKKTLHIHSPNAGIVVKKHIQEGSHVKPGMPLYTVADLSKVWVYADIYEYELPWLKEGAEARMTLSYYPGKTFVGKVTYIYPYLEAKTRTIKARLEFDNPGLALKPEMYANVMIATGTAKEEVAVPTEAVIRSGERNIVVVSIGNGRFLSRDVILGAAGEGYYQVASGLAAGEKVVTSAQFLIDSESRLREAVSKMLQPDTDETVSDHAEMEGMTDHSQMGGKGGGKSHE